MAVDSLMVPIGTPAPDFDLPTIDGGRVSLTDIDSTVLVVMFLCNHCPYVKHVEGQLGEIADTFAGDAVTFVGICSNDTETHPDDGPEGLRDQATRAGWDFPYAIDESQDVARDYRAACTPDFFVYGSDRTLVYRGAMDDSSPGNGEPLTGSYLRDAISRTLNGEVVPNNQKPSMGCSIKWRE